MIAYKCVSMYCACEQNTEAARCECQYVWGYIIPVCHYIGPIQWLLLESFGHAHAGVSTITMVCSW